MYFSLRLLSFLTTGCEVFHVIFKLRTRSGLFSKNIFCCDRYCLSVNIVADLEKLGVNLDQASKTYENAHKKLTSGRGNLVRQAEMLKDLGVKPTKQLPTHLTEIE